MGKPHKYAEVIKAWADGATAQYFNRTQEEWFDVKSPTFDEELQWRIKPEPVYPESSLSDDELSDIFEETKDKNWIYGFRLVANTALKKFCQDQEKEGK